MKLPPWEWMERVIRIDSTTHRSNDELVRFLLPLVKETGLKILEHPVMEGTTRFTNLIAYSHSPTAADLLLLNTHLDTVSPGSPEDWTKTGGDPFRLTRVRDRIYGLGTADVKLDFLCKLWALQQHGPPSKPVALVGTFGEERSLNGAVALLKEKKVAPRYALVGEPSNLELVYAHKGHLILTAVLDLEPPVGESQQRHWKGKAAHSATPDLGDNALVKALREARKRGLALRSLDAGQEANRVPDRCTAQWVAAPSRGSQRLFALWEKMEDIAREARRRRDTRFAPPFTTLSLNRAHTDGTTLTLTWDSRTLPDLDMEKWRQKLIRAVEGAGAKVASVTLDPPLKGTRNGRFIQAAAKALKASGVAPLKRTKATSTEAALYNRFGAEAIVFGPGISVGNVHRPNEHNSLKQMALATAFYGRLLEARGEAF